MFGLTHGLGILPDCVFHLYKREILLVVLNHFGDFM